MCSPEKISALIGAAVTVGAFAVGYYGPANTLVMNFAMFN